MSVKMISDANSMQDGNKYCSLCNHIFDGTNDYSKTKEHIFPMWLQKRFSLGNAKITLPNNLGKKYRTICIDICRKCNNNKFSNLENKISSIF